MLCGLPQMLQHLYSYSVSVLYIAYPHSFLHLKPHFRPKTKTKASQREAKGGKSQRKARELREGGGVMCCECDSLVCGLSSGHVQYAICMLFSSGGCCRGRYIKYRT